MLGTPCTAMPCRSACEDLVFGLQVLQDYAQYGDAMVGRYGIRPDGTPSPNVRTLVKPLLNLFHGERGCKRWKQAVDSELRTATSVSGLLEVSRQPPLQLLAQPVHRVEAKSLICLNLATITTTMQAERKVSCAALRMFLAVKCNLWLLCDCRQPCSTFLMRCWTLAPSN